MRGVNPTTMSDEAESGKDREVSRRFAEVEDELRRGGLVSKWLNSGGMVGMAGMFVATIALAMYIRPYYDVGGHAELSNTSSKRGYRIGCHLCVYGAHHLLGQMG